MGCPWQKLLRFKWLYEHSQYGVPKTRLWGHGRSFFVAAPTTFLRREECDQPDKHHPSVSELRFGQGNGSPTRFSRVGYAPPAVAALLLLQAGNGGTNPCPSCYACGQNLYQSDTPLVCNTPACGTRTHNQTRYSETARTSRATR